MAVARSETEVLMDEKLHYTSKMVGTVFVISCGIIAYAYAGAIIGTTLGQPSFLEYMGLATNPNAEGLIGTITGLFYAGGFFGVICNSFLVDRIGRRWTVAVGASVLVVATACLAGSANIAMFIVFRFFAGFGAYMLYLTVPLWVTELVPPRGRSVLAGITGLCGVIGYILAAYVGVGFYYYQGHGSSEWRAPLAIGCLPALIILAAVKFLPESPRYLLEKNRPEEAWEVIKAFHTRHDDSEHAYAMAEFSQMHRTSEVERTLDSSWRAILKRPSNRKRAAIAFALPCIVYSTGNLVITTYAASIFAGIGFSSAQSLHLLAGTYLAAIAGNLMSLLYVDRVPRNVILSVGVLAVTVVLPIYTALVASFLESGQASGLSAAAAFLFLFLCVFNLFLEGPSLYYTSEIFPTHLRGKGMTINVAAFCLIDILWLELAPTATVNIGWKYYLVFICVSVPGAALIYFKFPDTLRKPLEEIALLFGDEDLVPVQQDQIMYDSKQHQVFTTEHAAKTSDSV